jgi:Fe-S-cluster containining protein
MNSRQRREGRRIALTQYDELEAIYARIPRIECKGLCHTSCGHIGLSEIEALRMRQYDGKDAPTMAPIVKELLTGTDSGMCPKLTPDKRCSVYPVRPAICRLYGAVNNQRLVCPYGCLPERWLSDLEARVIMDAIKHLSIERCGQPE